MNRQGRLFAALSAVVLATSACAQTSPATGCTSKWGPDDQIGAVNNITPANVLAANKLIKRGKSA